MARSSSAATRLVCAWAAGLLVLGMSLLLSNSVPVQASNCAANVLDNSGTLDLDHCPSCNFTGRGLVTYSTMTPMPDELWDMLSEAGNYFAASPQIPYMAPTYNGSCLQYVDPYGLVTNDPNYNNPNVPRISYDLPLTPVLNQSTSGPWVMDVLYMTVCNNQANSVNSMTCTISHSVTKGYTDTTTVTNTFGGKMSVSNNVKSDLFVAGGSVTVTAEISYSWAHANAQTNSETYQDSMSVTIQAPPNSCYVLYLQAQHSEATGTIYTDVPVTGQLAYSANSWQGFPVNVTWWMSAAEASGMVLNDQQQRLKEGYYTAHDDLTYTYYSADVWVVTNDTVNCGQHPSGTYTATPASLEADPASPASRLAAMRTHPSATPLQGRWASEEGQQAKQVAASTGGRRMLRGL